MVTVRQILSSLIDDTDTVIIINNDTWKKEFVGKKERCYEILPNSILDSAVNRMYSDPMIGNVIYREVRK